MHTTRSRPKLVVSADGHGAVNHDGSRLLAYLADATTTVTSALSDGGEAIADLAMLRDQSDVFGPVASTPTAWRVLAGINEATHGGARQVLCSGSNVIHVQLPSALVHLAQT